MFSSPTIDRSVKDLKGSSKQEGLLNMQRSNGGWKERYVVLTGAALYRFTGADSEVCKGCWPLEGSAVWDASAQMRRKFTIGFVTKDGETAYFQAKNYDLHNDWIDSIEECIVKYGEIDTELLAQQQPEFSAETKSKFQSMLKTFPEAEVIGGGLLRSQPCIFDGFEGDFFMTPNFFFFKSPVGQDHCIPINKVRSIKRKGALHMSDTITFALRDFSRHSIHFPSEGLQSVDSDMYTLITNTWEMVRVMEHDVANPGNDDWIAKQGKLKKRGEGGHWQDRYVVLKHGTLLIYKGEGMPPYEIGEGLPGCLGLEGCQVRKADGELFEPFTLVVQFVADPEAAPYYFQAESYQDQMDWIASIEAKAIQKTKEVGLSLPTKVLQELHIEREKLTHSQDSAEYYKHLHTISPAQRKAEERAAEQVLRAKQEKERQEEVDQMRREQEAVTFKENWKTLGTAEREHAKARTANDAIKRERLEELRKQFSSQV